MIEMNSKISRKAVFIDLITRKPWLTPVIYTVYSLQGATLSELRENLGVRTSVVKRALWWLMKHGIVEKTGEKYIITREYTSVVDELFLNSCRVGKSFAFKIGSTYFIAIVRNSKITAYSVPEKYLREISSLKLENMKPTELSREANIPVKLASHIIKLYSILKNCKKP